MGVRILEIQKCCAPGDTLYPLRLMLKPCLFQEMISIMFDTQLRYCNGSEWYIELLGRKTERYTRQPCSLCVEPAGNGQLTQDYKEFC